MELFGSYSKVAPSPKLRLKHLLGAFFESKAAACTVFLWQASHWLLIQFVVYDLICFTSFHVARPASLLNCVSISYVFMYGPTRNAFAIRMNVRHICFCD
jgi:hypothetical protein